MFPLAGQTAGPIRLNFFVDTHGWPRDVLSKAKKFGFFFLQFFFKNVFIHGQLRALQLVFNNEDAIVLFSKPVMFWTCGYRRSKEASLLCFHRLEQTFKQRGKQLCSELLIDLETKLHDFFGCDWRGGRAG